MSAAKPATAGAAGAPLPASPHGGLWQSAIGRKALMAASGLVLVGWLVGHLLGNLQAFEGEERLDRYAELLRSVPALLWTARIVLLVAALVHVVAAVQLWAERRRARPVAYAEWRATGSSLASRTMIWSGVLVLGFAVYHLLDLTFGPTNPDFREGEVFHNLVASLGRSAAAGFYVVAVAGLGVHLWHGLWSTFQSLGLATRGAMTGLRRFAAVFAIAMALGFAAVPLAVVLGFIGG